MEENLNEENQNNIIYCYACGAKNSNDSYFCSSCGAQFRQKTPQEMNKKTGIDEDKVSKVILIILGVLSVIFGGVLRISNAIAILIILSLFFKRFRLYGVTALLTTAIIVVNYLLALFILAGLCMYN